MSIEQEINRNTMTIAELVKAVRELTEAIKGAGTAAAKAGNAGNAFEKLSATAEANPQVFHTTMKPGVPTTEYATQDIADLVTLVQQVNSGEAPLTASPIEPDTRPFTEVVAEQVVEEAEPADQNRYFHDTVHRAAYKIAPTEPLNGLQARAGVEEINAEQYHVLKAEYTKLTDRVIAGNVKAAPAEPTVAPAATPPSAPAAAAPSPTVTSSEPPWSEPEPAASPAELAPPVAEPLWPEVHATLMRLVKTAGCGAPQLIALLEDFGVKRPETALALQTKAVGRFAEIIANAELRMKGGAA